MLKNLKSLFIVTEPDAAATPSTGEATEEAAAPKGRLSPKPLNDRRTDPVPSQIPNAVASASETANPAATDATPRANGTVNTEIVGRLLDGIDRNDLEGFDYLEYKRSLKAMESLPMDEATRYRSAFATASTVGATTEKLLSSVEYYLHVLEQERTEFDSVVERQSGSQIAARRRDLDATQALIAEKEERIRALQAEIEQHRADAASVAESLAAAEANIHNTKLDFEASYDYVRQLFSADAEKMRQYLK